jgi:superfamily II DNA or RNA helicase
VTSDELVPLAFFVSPSGEVHLDAHPPQANKAPARIASELAQDFRLGPGYAILQLAARYPGAVLPASVAFFRDAGALFLTRAAAAPGVAALRGLPPPAGDLARLLHGAPPLTGGEYLNEQAMESLWNALRTSLGGDLERMETEASPAGNHPATPGGPLERWFKERNPAWHAVGRVCFHLAQNKEDQERPFAFLATYTTRLSREARPQHRPLGQALEDFAGDKTALLSLLLPVQRAAAESALVKDLAGSGQIYQTLFWTADEAYRFLLEVPALEAAGLTVRVPDWWKSRPRVTTQVTMGGKAPAAFGLQALIDFDIRVAAFGETLSEEEWRALAKAQSGLALVRGRWVELDREKLDAVLAHWKKVQQSSRGSISLLDAMRLLAGTASGTDAPEPLDRAIAEWSDIASGPWLKEALAGLRGPQALEKSLPGAELRAELRPYQEVGVRWLSLVAGLGLGACLADDMGLGKTIQILAFLLARKRAGAAAGPSLLVVPASLLGNWAAEIARFAPSLRVRVEHPSAAARSSGSNAVLTQHDLIVTTYGSLLREAWPTATSWDVVILDEAQAIKNPAAKQTRAVKSIKAQARIALTGTPVENRASDLWSIFDFLNPGLLGSAAAFGRFMKKLDRSGYGPLRELTQPYLLRRLKTDKHVISDLPEKTELTAYCALSRQQAALYQETVARLKESIEGAEGIQRRGLVLASLLRLKQICNHPSQWLRDGRFAADASGKFVRLRELAEEIASRQDRVLVFTQFREMTAPLAELLSSVFGGEGLVLHGQTKVGERPALVDRFQRGEAPFFVLSTKAGGVGLNLTAAAHVIHFDRWWNPAVEEQATDRAFRIGQKRNVLVHKFVCRGTVEEKIDRMLAGKKRLAGDLLEGGAEARLSEMSDAELLRTVSLDLASAIEESG